MRCRSKYGAKKVTVNGVTFDSQKEYRRFCELSLLERAGKITELKRQVKFELIPSQKIDGKVVERACNYVADFVYKMPITMEKTYFAKGKSGSLTVNCGFETIVEDTKGFKTTDYIIKRKLMLHKYGIRIKEV